MAFLTGYLGCTCPTASKSVHPLGPPQPGCSLCFGRWLATPLHPPKFVSILFVLFFECFLNAASWASPVPPHAPTRGPDWAGPRADPMACPCRRIKGNEAPWTGRPMGLPMGCPKDRPKVWAKSLGLYSSTFGGQDLPRKHHHKKSTSSYASKNRRDFPMNSPIPHPLYPLCLHQGPPIPGGLQQS